MLKVGEKAMHFSMDKMRSIIVSSFIHSFILLRAALSSEEHHEKKKDDHDDDDGVSSSIAAAALRVFPLFRRHKRFEEARVEKQ